MSKTHGMCHIGIPLRSLTLLAPSIPDVELIVLGRNLFVALPTSLGDLLARYDLRTLCDRHRVIRPGAPGGACRTNWSLEGRVNGPAPYHGHTAQCVDRTLTASRVLCSGLSRIVSLVTSYRVSTLSRIVSLASVVSCLYPQSYRVSTLSRIVSLASVVSCL